MSRAYGVTATLGGKKVRWAGDEYGWQSPASYTKLEAKGQFKLGRKELDALTRYLGPIAQTVGNFQQQVRKATPWLDPVEKTVNRAMVGDDKLPSSRVSQGGAVLAQKAGNAANLDPRLSMALPFLVGAVSTSGASALDRLSSHPHYGPGVAETQRILAELKAKKTGPSEWDLVKEQLAAFEATQKPLAKLKAKKTGTTTPKPVAAPPVVEAAPAPTKSFTADVPQNPLKEGSPPWARSSELETNRSRLIAGGLPDPNLRFRPEKSIEKVDRKTKESIMTPIDSTGKPTANINDFYSKKGAYSVSKGDKTFKLNGEVVTTKGATSREAEIRKMPGMEDVTIDWHEAHHVRPLKDTFDYANTFDDINVALKAIDATGTPRGSSVLNRVDLPKRLHTGKVSAHSRLRNESPNSPEAGFPLEAQSGTNRWQFLKNLKSDTERLKYMPYVTADTGQNVRVALEQAFSEYLLPLNGTHNPFKDRYVGNFSQRVMMPFSKEAGEYNRQILRIRRAEVKAKQ